MDSPRPFIFQELEIPHLDGRRLSWIQTDRSQQSLEALTTEAAATRAMLVGVTSQIVQKLVPPIRDFPIRDVRGPWAAPGSDAMGSQAEVVGLVLETIQLIQRRLRGVAKTREERSGGGRQARGRGCRGNGRRRRRFGGRKVRA